MMAVTFEAVCSMKRYFYRRYRRDLDIYMFPSAIKLSRTVLSTERDSLPLWGLHARLERARGKLNDARRVYETVLSTADDSSQGVAKLWWAWAEMEWLAGDDERARSVIFRAAGAGGSGGAMALLRVNRALEEKMRSVANWKEREAWACLRALLDVLAGGAHAIEDGMQILEKYIQEVALDALQRESAWTRMLLLEWKHAAQLRRQVRRGPVRKVVERALREVEEGGGINTIALGVFLEGEKGESVWGRVRALLAESGEEKSLVRRIWEVWLANWKIGKWEEERERIRTSLGIAVNEDR